MTTGDTCGLVYGAVFGARYDIPVKLESRITLTPGVRGGKPCIRGTRITVYDILEYLAGGMSETEIVADFSDLSVADVQASLVFAAVRERRLSSPSAA